MKLRQAAKAHKLSDAHVDRLGDLDQNSEGLRALADLIDSIVAHEEAAVIRMSSSEGPERLFNAKIRAEGARKLATEIRAIFSC